MAGADNLNTLGTLEVKRKLFHILLGSILTVLIYFSLIEWWMLLIILILGFILSIWSKNQRIIGIDWFLKNFDRPEHLKKLPGQGVLAIVFSSMILVLFTPKEIAAAALMIWTFGDSMAAIIGKYSGRWKHPLNDKKTLEGTLVGILVATIASTPFVTLWPAFLASAIALFLESIEFRFTKFGIEDNILVPLSAGLVLIIIL